MNKWATVTQLVNGRAREVLQNYVNTVLLCHIWWVASCWVTLMDVVNSPCAQGYMLHLNRFSFFMYKHSYTQNFAICSQKNTILISFCCSFSTSAHQRSSKERILRMRYFPSLEPATVEGGDASSSWDQCCCFFWPQSDSAFYQQQEPQSWHRSLTSGDCHYPSNSFGSLEPEAEENGLGDGPECHV